MNNEELELSVTNELFWDPKIDSEAVAISAKDGVVTLRGTVGSFRQRREATKATERVRGVVDVDVDNELEVSILTEQRRSDADPRGRAAGPDARLAGTVKRRSDCQGWACHADRSR
jgi:hypothetical protein